MKKLIFLLLLFSGAVYSQRPAGYNQHTGKQYYRDSVYFQKDIQIKGTGTPGFGSVLMKLDTFGRTRFIPIDSLCPACNGSPSAAWQLTGNAGTDPNTNFIGTTDNQPLMFKVNNVEYGRLQEDSSWVFFGFRAGESNIGNSVVGIGNGAASYNEGNFCDFIGESSGNLNTGNHVVGIGNLAANQNTGSNVVAIGESAANQNTHSQVIALGSGATPTASNQFIFSDSIQTFVSRNASYGIGTVSPTAKLHVNGDTYLQGELKYSLAGHDTLVAGIDTVYNSAVLATSLIFLTAQHENGTTAVGTLTVTAIVPNDYFIVKSLKQNATVETSDTRHYNWMIIQKE